MPRSDSGPMCHKSDCYTTEGLFGWERWATQAEYEYYRSTGDIHPSCPITDVRMSMMACSEHVFDDWINRGHLTHAAECPCPDSACTCNFEELEDAPNA